MPELPEVETVTRGIAAQAQGIKIRAVELRRKDLRVPFPENLEDRIRGRTLEKCSRRAKYSLLHLSGGLTLVIHLGMSGRISFIEPQHVPNKPEKHDHMIITFDTGLRMVLNDARRFGMVFLCETDSLDRHKAFSHLGPEPLSDDFTADALSDRLIGKRTDIKAALFDQRIVVGLGNIYICEALFRTGIHPQRQAGSLTKRENEFLVDAIKDILSEAIESGGSSLKDYRQTDGTLGYFQHSFAVYGRKGEACPGCNCDVEKTGGVDQIKQAGRSTFFCPRKQRKG